MAKRKKSNLQWIKETLELKPDHHWESPPGYKIFVAGRGAVRLNVPQNWVFEPQETSFKLSQTEHQYKILLSPYPDKYRFFTITLKMGQGGYLYCPH